MFIVIYVDDFLIFGPDILRINELKKKINNESLVYQQKGDYDKDRAELGARGDSLAFDYTLAQAADQLERDADRRLKIMKHNDDVVFYDGAPERKENGGQKHRRFAGDHFMSNADLLETTGLYHVAQRLPKGAHLHIHFNSTLLPNVLLDIAEGMDTMCICSNLPLTSLENLSCCEIQFLVKQDDVIKTERAKLLEDEKRTRASKELESEMCNLLSERYQCPQVGQGLWMRYNDFRKQWENSEACRLLKGLSSKEWLISKLVFNEQEAHHPAQTADGAWVKFNGRTRMMKGLFNYERAFREYTRRCLKEFERDNIQYAEIRLNFMQTNQIWRNNGSGQLTNKDTMDAIIEEWTKFDKEDNKLFGLKVIYCTPRSFPNHLVEKALDECLDFKLVGILVPSVVVANGSLEIFVA
ncbi:adenosine deaminase [Xylariales sp. AK1849]|nr:adenosine deaminase [Xylariales sp. AK1849]